MKNAKMNHYTALAVQRDFWARLTDDGWVQCERSHPDAEPDLNRAIRYE